MKKSALNAQTTQSTYISKARPRFLAAQPTTAGPNIKPENPSVVKFDTAKDLKDDFTQFYSLAYKYETDCLSASFEYVSLKLDVTMMMSFCDWSVLR